MVVVASKGCGTTVILAEVPFIVAVERQAVFPVVPPTQIEQLSKKAVPCGVPAQSKQDASVFPQPQFPGVALLASAGQASPAVATYPFGLVQAFTVLVASPSPSLSPSAYQVTVEPIVICMAAEVALQPEAFDTSTV